MQRFVPAVVVQYKCMVRSHRMRGRRKYQRVRPNLIPCPNLVLFVSTTVCCAGRSATRYRAVREPLPRVPTAFHGSKFVRGELT